MIKYISALFFLIFSISTTFAQDEQYAIVGVGFYNFENLFDTLDTPNVRDTEFTPAGSKQWNAERYMKKLTNLSTVVADLGTELTPDGLALLGVAEVENRAVLEDFIVQPKLKDRNYQIIHFDSPDKRGIDVALLYQPKYFRPTKTETIPLKIFTDDGEQKYTRDILMVQGVLDGDMVTVFVNHWPSRGGGPASIAWRNAAAMQVKLASDKIKQTNPNAKMIIMGDLNDDPSSPSCKKILDAKEKPKKVKEGGWYNTMYHRFKNGDGTLAYNDAWNLFDQLIISSGLLKDGSDHYTFYKEKIYKPKYMFQKTGRFKGYPFRTYGGSTYLGGYSDHFPVYLFLKKKVG